MTSRSEMQAIEDAAAEFGTVEVFFVAFGD